MEFLQITFQTAGIKTYLFIPPVVAFVISFFTSMAGISGAFLLLPFQLSLLGFTSPSVSATNFLYNVVGCASSVADALKPVVKANRFAFEKYLKEIDPLLNN